MRQVFIVSLVIGLGGCAHATPKSSPFGRPDCAGQLTFIVSNRSNRDVDVLARPVNGSSAGVALGTVRPETSEEFFLPLEVLGAYTQVAKEGSMAPARGPVETRYSCRP
jgi:hypothetical protein